MNQLQVTSETAVYPRANMNHKAPDRAREMEVKSNLEQQQ